MNRSIPAFRPEPQLAEPAGAGVEVEHREQVVLALVGPGRDDLARRRTPARCPTSSRPSRQTGKPHRSRPRGRVLDRPGEDLARGHVAPAVGVDPGPAGDREGQVGPLGLDPDGPDARHELDQPRLPTPQLLPGRDRVGRGRGTSPRRRTPRSRPAPSRRRRRRRRSGTGSGPSASAARRWRIGSRARSTTACRRGSTRRIDRVSLSAAIRIRPSAVLGLGRSPTGGRWASCASVACSRKNSVSPGSSSRTSGCAPRRIDRLVARLDQRPRLQLRADQDRLARLDPRQ